MYLHSLQGQRPLNGGLGLSVVVWMQAKVRERGLSLWFMLSLTASMQLLYAACGAI